MLGTSRTDLQRSLEVLEVVLSKKSVHKLVKGTACETRYRTGRLERGHGEEVQAD